MNTIRNKPLVPLSGGRWTRIGLGLALASLFTTGVLAQSSGEGIADPPRDTNKELRTCTWSIYAQGGLSWTHGVWYNNRDAKRSYKLAPAVGGGIDFTIRPWVRVGTDYIWSRYRREQRFDELNARAVPAKAYGNYLMNTHNVKLGVQFNFMELWPNRKAQWLNIWLGTGVGGTFARGNEYGMWMSNTLTQNGTDMPIRTDAVVSNGSDLTITGRLVAANRDEEFNKLYIPATLHVEADVSRRFTLGLKGEIDWLLNRKQVAPKRYTYAMATVRYNFVPSRARKLQDHYTDELLALNGRISNLLEEAKAVKVLADHDAKLRKKAEQENDNLKRRLDDCQKSKSAVAEATGHYVQFAHNSSSMSREETERLRSFARSMKGQKLSILAEASTPGTPEYNQALSERRLKRVVKVLLKEGFAPSDLYPQTAIGARNGKATFEGRRVTIQVKK